MKKSIFSNLCLAMSSLLWKMCFTKLIQIYVSTFWRNVLLCISRLESLSGDACTCVSYLDYVAGYLSIIPWSVYKQYLQQILSIFFILIHCFFKCAVCAKNILTNISTLKYCEYMCPGLAWSECMNYLLECNVKF